MAQVARQIVRPNPIVFAGPDTRWTAITAFVGLIALGVSRGTSPGLVAVVAISASGVGAYIGFSIRRTRREWLSGDAQEVWWERRGKPARLVGQGRSHRLVEARVRHSGMDPEVWLIWIDESRAALLTTAEARWPVDDVRNLALQAEMECETFRDRETVSPGELAASFPGSVPWTVLHFRALMFLVPVLAFAAVAVVVSLVE